MKNKLKIPAIGLVVLGLLGVVAGLFGMFATIDPQDLVGSGITEEQAAKIAEAIETGGTALHVLGVLLSGFVVWAGFQMLQRRAWTACVIANVLVMVPCITSCCCVLGLPIGVFGLITLFDAEVKRSFQGQSGAQPPV